MVAMKKKRDLFGGALRCAGLVAAASISSGAMADFEPLANGPGFVPSQGGFYGYGPASYVYQFGYTYAAAFTPSYSYSANGFSAHATANSTYIGTALSITDAQTWTYGVSLVIQWFTADTLGKEVTFAWDLTAATGVAYVYQVGVGLISPLGSSGNAGSATLFLDNGNTYAFLAQVVVNGTTGGGFAYITNIPAPGSLALLGVGLMGARRRRKRE